MSLDIGEALSNGARRAVKRNAAMLFVVFLVLGVVSTVATQTALEPLTQQLLQRIQETSEEPLPPQTVNSLSGAAPLAIPLPAPVAALIVLVTGVLGLTARILADRTFVSEKTKHLHEPRRRIGWATLFTVIATIIIYSLLFLLFFVPTLLLAVMSPILAVVWLLIGVVVAIFFGISFFFFRQEISVEDTGPIEAFSNSWSLVKGDRFEVLGLAIVFAVISGVVGLAGGTVQSISPLASSLLSVVLSAGFAVFATAVSAQAFRQLRAEKRAGESTDVTGEVDSAETTGDATGTDGTDESDVTTGDDEWEPDDEWDDPPM